VRLAFNSLFLLALLVAATANTWSADGPIVRVEAMIGEATVILETDDGQTDSVLVPTGKVTQADPKTGKSKVETSTSTNKVNAVVRAIAAAAPDARSGSTGEGCSRGERPLRTAPRPEYDAATAAAIDAQLASLSEGELMMVIAVLNNNARHLCVDSSTVADTVGQIAAAQPQAAANVVFVATLLDPVNANSFNTAAVTAAPEQAGNIQKAQDAAQNIKKDSNATNQPPPDTGTNQPPSSETEQGTPPGGAIGANPSPE
jgi:hypothetical protein